MVRASYVRHTPMAMAIKSTIKSAKSNTKKATKKNSFHLKMINTNFKCDFISENVWRYEIIEVIKSV